MGAFVRSGVIGNPMINQDDKAAVSDRVGVPQAKLPWRTPRVIQSDLAATERNGARGTDVFPSETSAFS